MPFRFKIFTKIKTLPNASNRLIKINTNLGKKRILDNKKVNKFTETVVGSKDKESTGGCKNNSDIECPYTSFA
jgi:hypothetical protein